MEYTVWQVKFKDSYQKMKFKCYRGKKQTAKIVTEWGDEIDCKCSLSYPIEEYFSSKVEKLEYLGGEEMWHEDSLSFRL